VITKEQLEDEGFESSYVRCFNYLKERGWVYEDAMWVSPLVLKWRVFIKLSIYR
jgi:hypothetical protein